MRGCMRTSQETPLLRIRFPNLTVTARTSRWQQNFRLSRLFPGTCSSGKSGSRLRERRKVCRAAHSSCPGSQTSKPILPSFSRSCTSPKTLSIRVTLMPPLRSFSPRTTPRLSLS
eukprot:Rmarinus@m.25222